MSLKFPYLNPGIMGAKGAWYFGFGVADREPIVRPWKELWKERSSCLEPEGSSTLPTLRANFMAASLASEPELQMKALETACIEPDSRVLSIMSLESSPVQGL